MTALAKVAATAVVLAATVVASQSVGDHGDAGAAVLGPGVVTVDLGIEYSAFSVDTIRVRPGTTIRFAVDNRDPINHELIVGDAGVHARHEAGTEPAHPPRPGEVTIPALTAAETTFEFTVPGSVVFACHLPGHFAYGMHGVVEVLA